MKLITTSTERDSIETLSKLRSWFSSIRLLAFSNEAVIFAWRTSASSCWFTACSNNNSRRNTFGSSSLIVAPPAIQMKFVTDAHLPIALSSPLPDTVELQIGQALPIFRTKTILSLEHEDAAHQRAHSA